MDRACCDREAQVKCQHQSINRSSPLVEVASTMISVLAAHCTLQSLTTYMVIALRMVESHVNSNGIKGGM